MSIQTIVDAIDQHILNLRRARSLLVSTPSLTEVRPGRRPGPGKAKTITAGALTAGKRKTHKMSAEGRARIVAAQKARWAKSRKK